MSVKLVLVVAVAVSLVAAQDPAPSTDTPMPSTPPPPTDAPILAQPGEMEQVLLFISTMVCNGINAADVDEEFGPDVCTWSYVSCDDVGHVTTLLMQYRNCSGTANLRNLPTKLEKLALDNNILSGTLDLTALPHTLTQMTLDNNLFHGTPDLTYLPNVMHRLTLNRNQLDGELDLTYLPASLDRPGLYASSYLRGLQLQDNFFCGTSEVNGSSINSCLVIRPPTTCTCDGSTWTCPPCTTPYVITPMPPNCLPQYPQFPSVYTSNPVNTPCYDLGITCDVMYLELQQQVANAQCQCDSCPTALSRWLIRQRYIALRAACDQFLSYYCSSVVV